SLIFQTEKQIKEYGDKIPADKKSVIESSLETLKSAHAAKDLAGIDSAMEALNNAWQAASQDIYAAEQAAGANAQGAPNANNASGASGDNVQDVEFEEVK
ncbi:MAG: Hsp70 family protein, partial [Bacteroidia bacterium]